MKSKPWLPYTRKSSSTTLLILKRLQTRIPALYARLSLKTALKLRCCHVISTILCIQNALFNGQTNIVKTNYNQNAHSVKRNLMRRKLKKLYIMMAIKWNWWLCAKAHILHNKILAEYSKQIQLTHRTFQKIKLKWLSNRTPQILTSSLDPNNSKNINREGIHKSLELDY